MARALEPKVLESPALQGGSQYLLELPSSGRPNTLAALQPSGDAAVARSAPLAQRQSNGLLIRRFRVRIPRGAPVGMSSR